jgi:hypothetical protein
MTRIEPVLGDCAAPLGAMRVAKASSNRVNRKRGVLSKCSYLFYIYVDRPSDAAGKALNSIRNRYEVDLSQLILAG